MEENVAGTNVDETNGDDRLIHSWAELVEVTDDPETKEIIQEFKELDDNGQLVGFVETLQNISNGLKESDDELAIMEREFEEENGYSIHTGVPDDWIRIPLPSEEIYWEETLKLRERPKDTFPDRIAKAWHAEGIEHLSEEERFEWQSKFMTRDRRNCEKAVLERLKREGKDKLPREERDAVIQQWVNEGSFR